MSATNTEVAFIDELLFIEQVLVEPKAFIALYDHYFPRVYNYIRYRCNDPETTDDLTAQVFEKALRKIGDYDSKKGSFRAWLFAIARNQVNYHLRAQQRRRFVPLDEIREYPNDLPSPEDVLIKAEMENALLEAFSKIPERERDLLSLKFAARLSNRRISEITGLTESNVGVILHRAVEKLRISLKNGQDETNRKPTG